MTDHNDTSETPKAPRPLPKSVTIAQSKTFEDRTLDYTVTVDSVAIHSDETHEHTADICYTAYALDGQDVATRPLTFVFNGGPGAASIWLHMGGLAPIRAEMDDEGWMPKPPYRAVDNPSTWLDETDMVFVDPVGTGFSRATDAKHEAGFWNLEGDIASLVQFIRQYLTTTGRWASPLYLAGESYGTMRSAGVAGKALEHGIAFEGILLISMTLNFQTLQFDAGNDLPYPLHLPTYTATAWYHRQLSSAMQEQPLADVLRAVEQWIEETYLIALHGGARLDPSTFDTVATQLAAFTGLPQAYVEQSDLRVEIRRFCKSLLREQQQTVGRLDTRFTGQDRLATDAKPEFDPSLIQIVPPYTAVLNDYYTRVMGYRAEREYVGLSWAVNRGWAWDRGVYPDTSEALRQAMSQHPHMRVFVASGYYDLATPYYATAYTLAHMGLPAADLERFTLAYYESGHMLYLHKPSLEKLKMDVSAFYGKTD